MGCTKCGTDFSALKLMMKDLIRQMIDEGKLQEGLIDCQDKRLWRDARVVTCDILGDAVCEMIKNGDICINEPEALVYAEDTGELKLIMSDGTTLDTTLSLDDTKLKAVAFDNNTKVAKFTLTDNTSFNLDLSTLLSTENVGSGLEFAGNKLNVKVDDTTIRIDNGVLKAVIPAPYNDSDVKRRLTALEQKRHTATVEIKGLFDETVGFAHTSTEKD